MKIDSQDQRSFWQEHIKIQSSSGVSAASYCRTHGLSDLSFYKWRVRLNGRRPSIRRSFAAVKVSARVSPTPGIRVRVTEFELMGGVEDLRAMFISR